MFACGALFPLDFLILAFPPKSDHFLPNSVFFTHFLPNSTFFTRETREEKTVVSVIVANGTQLSCTKTVCWFVAVFTTFLLVPPQYQRRPRLD